MILDCFGLRGQLFDFFLFMAIGYLDCRFFLTTKVCNCTHGCRVYPWNNITSRDVGPSWDKCKFQHNYPFFKSPKITYSNTDTAYGARFPKSKHSAQRNKFTDKLPLRSLKVGKKNIFQITKYCNPLGLLENQTIFRPTQNPIVLNIENNGPVLPFPLVL